MKRRQFLKSAGAATSLALLAGCISGGTGGGDGNDNSGNDSDSGSNEDSGSKDKKDSNKSPDNSDSSKEDMGGPKIQVSKSQLSVTESSGGLASEAGKAEVKFSPSKNQVTVSGTIQGKNGCQTAKLKSSSYNPKTGELSVNIVAEKAEDAGDFCTQALIGIRYEISVDLKGGMPKKVTVNHGMNSVTTATNKNTNSKQ